MRTRERMETAQPMYVIMEKAKAVSGGYRGRGGGGGGREEGAEGREEREREIIYTSLPSCMHAQCGVCDSPKGLHWHPLTQQSW